MKLRSVLDLLATLAMVSVAGAILWTREPRSAPTTAVPLPLLDTVSLDGAAFVGSETARVALIEYLDFQCTFCATFARTTLPALRRKYVDSGKVLMAFRHFPLETAHPWALAAANAAECAAEQNQFFRMHDRLFELFEQRAGFDEAAIDFHARSLGLDFARYRACALKDAGGKVRRDISGAKALAVKGTPTFFFGRVASRGTVTLTHRMAGARKLGEFEAVLDSLLMNLNDKTSTSPSSRQVTLASILLQLETLTGIDFDTATR